MQSTAGGRGSARAPPGTGKMSENIGKRKKEREIFAHEGKNFEWGNRFLEASQEVLSFLDFVERAGAMGEKEEREEGAVRA